MRGITRRQATLTGLAGLVAAPVAEPQEQTAPDGELAAAQAEIESLAARLAAFDLPVEVEPATVFQAS